MSESLLCVLCLAQSLAFPGTQPVFICQIELTFSIARVLAYSDEQVTNVSQLS